MSEPEAGPSPAGQGERGRRAQQGTTADVKMMERVRAAGANSAEASYLRDILSSHARGVLTQLHQANQLFARVKSLLLITLPAPPDDWQESADGLIYLSVEESLDKFFATAVFGGGTSRWRPNGGASIQTFFVNKCLFMFKDLYLKEYERRGSAEIPCSDISDEVDETRRLFLYSTTPEDPESRALDADEVRRIGQQMTPQEIDMVLEKYSGKTYKEIGRDFSKSDEAVSSSFQRFRRRIDC